MRYRRKIPLFGRGPGSDRFGRGSVTFPCHKHPEITVCIVDCMHCPFGEYYKDWQGTGWQECWFKWQKDLQHLRELEQKEEQEKRDWEEMLRRNQEENEELRLRQEKELREYEPKRRKIIEEVEKAMVHPYRVELLPPEDERINWDTVDGVNGDEENESDEEASGERD